MTAVQAHQLREFITNLDDNTQPRERQPKKDQPLLYTDIPTDVLQQAQEILNATIRPAATTSATIVQKPHGRIDDQAHKRLRQLRLAAHPASANASLLVHVWETYPTKLPQHHDTHAGPWTLRHVTTRDDVNALWYNQLEPGLHLRLPGIRSIPVLSRQDDDGDHQIWMSTADLELATMSDAVEDCQGHVLVAGLGLGIFPILATRKPDVASITVVEIDPHITAISSPYIDHPKVRVVNDSIEHFAQYPPPDAPTFDYCFYDVWPAIQDPYAEEQQARATVAHLMADDATVSMWCQALNNRKRRSMQRIQDLKSQAVRPTEQGTTCYQCAGEMPSSIAGLCIECALGTWHESPQLANQDFPIPPDDIPELAFRQAAQHALVALDPDLITALLDRATNAPTRYVTT